MEAVRALRVRLQNVILRAVADLAPVGDRYQVRYLGDRVRSNVELFQPQGVYFSVPAGGEGLLLSPAGESSNAVMALAHVRAGRPTAASVDPGEGGLHYLGTFGVFLDSDGLVHLGGGTAAADFVALAAKVTTQLSALKSAISGAAVSPGDGGASFKAALLSALASWPGDVAAEKVKAT